MLQLRSSGSVKTISLDRDRVLSELKSVASRVCREHPEVASIRLFGSLARGDHVGTSDVDILIVLLGGEAGDPLERIRAYLGCFKLPVAVDLLVYTEDDVADRIRSCDPQFERLWSESLDLLLCK